MEIENTTTQPGVSVHERLMSYLQGDKSPPEADSESSAVEDAESTEAKFDDEAAGETDTEVTEDKGVESDEDVGESRWMPKSLDELAEALEAKPDELMKLMRLRTKVDGEVGEATLEEVVKSFQLEQHLNRRSQQLAAERKEWAEQQERLRQQYESRLRETDDMVSALEQMIAADFNGINWKELQEEDPTQYLIQQNALQQRFSQLQALKQQVVQKREQEQNAFVQKQQEFQRQFMQRELDAVLDAIPDWRDEEKRAAEVNELGTYLMDVGFSQQELGNMMDHRAYVIARKAMLYDKMEKKVEPKKAQLKSKPKFVPPGARKTESDVKARKLAELKARSRNGDRNATHELLKMKLAK